MTSEKQHVLLAQEWSILHHTNVLPTNKNMTVLFSKIKFWKLLKVTQ